MRDNSKLPSFAVIGDEPEEEIAKALEENNEEGAEEN